MMASLKSEIRKLYTVRSTYGVLLFCFAIMLIYAFWAEGIKAGDSTRAVADPHKLVFLIRDAIANLAFFGGIVGILSMANEYRHNTIMYTLTASRSRSQTLIAKIIAISLFSVIFTLFVAILAPALMYLGITIKGLSLSHQLLPMSIVWQVLFVSWGYGVLGLLLATLVRQQVGAIATFFAFPIFVEPLVALVLKDNKIYLPFNALGQVATSEGFTRFLSHGKAALVFGIYLAIGWTVAWILFLRRDAA